AVAAHELHLHAELLELAQHGAGDRVHPAEEDELGALALDRREDGVEVGGLVVGELPPDDRRAGGLGGLAELVGDALAVGGAIVDDGDLLDLQFVHGIAPERAAELAVVGHDTEGGVVALLRVLGIGRRGRDLRDARVVVDTRRRDRGSRVQVADHADDIGVDSFWAAAVPCLGSAASSSESSSKRTSLPPILSFLALSSSIARRAPFSLSLPRWAIAPVSGATCPILTTV